MKKIEQNSENKTELRGNIDGVYHQQLTGWFYSPSEKDSTTLELSVDGKAAMTTNAILPRSDVAGSLGFGGSSGFSFNLDELEEEGVVEITISHKDSGFNFSGLSIQYCKGISQHFTIIKDLFYPEFYRTRYGFCHLSNEAAFQNFIKHGIFLDRDPNPWFSSEYYRENHSDPLLANQVPLLSYLAAEPGLEEKPSEQFDPKFYAATSPDLVDVHGMFWHFSTYGKREGRRGVKRELPEYIKAEFNDVTQIEPAVLQAEMGLSNIVRYPDITKASYLPKIVHERMGDDIKAIICIPFISRGGADLVSTLLFRAYQGALGKEHVLLLVTDQSTMDMPEWIDDGSKVICLDDECTFIDDEERLLSLHICIGKLAPEKIINVNSNTAWRLFERYGVQLSTVADLYAYLFCFDFDQERRRVGYITDFLPTTLKSLKAVFFDNKKIIQELATLYGFSDTNLSKLHTVYVPPVLTDKEVNYEQNEHRDTVLWAGRLCIQKRPDILIQIAEAMPGQLFDVYGSPGECNECKNIMAGKYPNIKYKGVFNSLDELEYENYVAFLNTSEWDGIPTILIQMAVAGLPIVTSAVGGIPELIDENMGWLIDDIEDTEQFVTALKRVIIKSEDAFIRSHAAKERVAVQHNWTKFYKTLESFNAFTDHHTMERVNDRFKDRRKAA